MEGAIFPGFWTTLLRMLVAALFCGAIGLERQIHVAGRAAGLRTHMMVGIGAALYVLVGIGLAGHGSDPGRIGAQVVTGIGFLGAGTIIRHRNGVHGLTTAASIWTAAAVGLAAGAGWYAGALVATLVAIGTLLGLRGFTERLERLDQPVPEAADRTDGERDDPFTPEGEDDD